MSVLMLTVAAAAAVASPPVCEGGAVIDLNLHPVVSLAEYAEEVAVWYEDGKDRIDHDYDVPVGFSAEARTFDAKTYLDSKGLTRAAIEKGGYLRFRNGSFLFSEGGFEEQCLLTYDKPPVDVMVAEQKLEEARKKQAMASVMICDPDETRSHAIKAPGPAGPIKIPIGQAAQNDTVFTISVSQAEDYRALGTQTVKIAGGKFVSAVSEPAGMFCSATSFDDMCVNTEAVFALTGWKPFTVNAEVDWYEMVLARCTVSR